MKYVSADGMATKHVFTTAYDGCPCEITAINKGDGKDIIVMPTQTNCHIGCRFCPLTYTDGKYRDLTAEELIDFLPEVIDRKEETLLFSWMGAGEPMCNVGLFRKLKGLNDVAYRAGYKHIRHAVASCIPTLSTALFHYFCESVKGWGVKLHWSLHFTDASQREKMMPRALPAAAAYPLVRMYAKQYPVEVHYTLIGGLNDTSADARRLNSMFIGTNIVVKLLRFSQIKNLTASNRVQEFASMLTCNHEVYDPPGRDIGASCGMLCVDAYNRRGQR